MPIPSKKEGEDKNKFMSRCMGDDVMNKEYPEGQQRYAVCVGKAIEGLSSIAAVDFQIKHNSESDEKAGYPPNCNEGYVEKDGKCIPANGESVAGYKYKDPVTGEIYEFARKGVYTKNGRVLIPA
tara:strand:- start:1811 stop:2185 length:375 start_codon:yes stop_codon:yes gene_type:complete